MLEGIFDDDISIFVKDHRYIEKVFTPLMGIGMVMGIAPDPDAVREYMCDMCPPSTYRAEESGFLLWLQWLFRSELPFASGASEFLKPTVMAKEIKKLRGSTTFGATKGIVNSFSVFDSFGSVFIIEHLRHT